MNYNQSAGDRLRSMVKMQPALSQLIIANIAVWFFLELVQLAGLLTHTAGMHGDQLWLDMVLSWISVPASVAVLMGKPWTIITYMFVQEGFWHLFFNMVWLFWFGKIFMEFMPGRKIYTIYFVGGISGALTYILAYNAFPVFQDTIAISTAIGASASVLAITIATAVLVPEYSVNLMFLGPVKIKYIAIFTVILDVLMIRSGNAGGHFAHLGGAISGALFVLFLRNNVLDRLGIKKIVSFISSPFRQKPLRKVYSTGRPLTDEEYNRQKVLKQQKLDLILDKISRSGYSSLSAEEKEILFNSSKNQ
ncbi:MAG: rhomboid family intramembrane serine protease [Bacteroidota bacterium]